MTASLTNPSSREETDSLTLRPGPSNGPPIAPSPTGQVLVDQSVADAPAPARPYGTRKTRAASNVSPASRTGRTASPGDAACASR